MKSLGPAAPVEPCDEILFKAVFSKIARLKNLECFETLKWDSAAAGDELQQSCSHLFTVGSNDIPEPDNLSKDDITPKNCKQR